MCTIPKVPFPAQKEAKKKKWGFLRPHSNFSIF
jgi:hypothetical protein